jgi:hypothetical protein
MLEKQPSLEKKVNIEDRMQKDGVEIVRSEPVHPLPLAWEGLEKLPEDQRNGIWPFLDILHFSSSQYANGILMLDSFGNEHTTRRQPWRQSMSEEFGDEFHEYDKRNKLRFNSINGVEDSLRSTIKALDKFEIHTPQAEALRSLDEKFPAVSASHYLTLSDDEKRQIVNSVDHIAREALSIITSAGQIDENTETV